MRASDRITTVELAKDRWPEILNALGVPAKVLNGRHQPCPFCGGKDRFRWTNYQGGGGFICSQCGNGNGFELLKRFHGWEFKQAARAVDGLLRGNWRISMHPGNRPAVDDVQKIPKSVQNCALWIRKHRPDELEGWLERHDIEVRWWLETQT